MSTPTVPSVDETYALLSHNRGRFILQYFDQHANPVKLEDLASLVARWEQDSGGRPSETAIEQVTEALDEEYLPWLAEMGLATYDTGGQMVRYDDASITVAMENAEDVLAFVWTPDTARGGQSAPADE